MVHLIGLAIAFFIALTSTTSPEANSRRAIWVIVILWSVATLFELTVLRALDGL